MNEWQPIETVPKDMARIILYRPSAPTYSQIVCGKWNDDRYARNPRPYFSHDLERLEGKMSTRENQPTHWMPVPDAPESA